MGNQVLSIIGNKFLNLEADLAFFGTLSLPHMNIDNIEKKDVVSQLNPFIVFKKSVASGLSFEPKEGQSIEGIERNFIASELLKQASSKSLKV